MKRIWSREDTEQLQAAMERHPAYLNQQQPAELAAVIDIHTRQRIA